MMLDFYLFGKLRIVKEGKELPLPPYRHQSLLALLLLRPHIQRREHMAELLFPGTTPAKGRRCLSDSLYHLHQTCPYLPIQSQRHSIRLESAAYWLDVNTFLLQTAASHSINWMDAINLYHAELLVDHFDDWLIEERESARLAFLHTAQRLRDEWVRRGKYQKAVSVAERLVQEEPFDEESLRRLMQIYQTLGQRGQALRVYDRFVNDICPELGFPPEPSTEVLASAIRDACPVQYRVLSVEVDSTDSATMLANGNAALLRGERAVVEAMLKVGKQNKVGLNEVRYLEFDLALRFDDITRAEQTLQQCQDETTSTLLRHARLAIAKHRWPQAAEAATQALMAANATRDKADEARALWALAFAYSQHGDRVQAYRATEQALTLARQSGLVDVQLDCLLLLARMGLIEGRTTQPGTHLAEALALAQRHGYRPNYALARRLSAWVHHAEGRLTEAQQAYEEALTIYRDMGMPKQEASLLNELADTHDLLGRSRQSLLLLQQAATLLEQFGDVYAIAVNQYNQGFAMLFLADDNAGSAARLAQQALKTFRRERQTGWIAATLVLFGFARWVERRFDDALVALQEAYNLHETLHEAEMFSEIMAHQTHCYLGLAQPGLALKSSKQALLSLIQGARVADVKVEVYFAHALALEANGQPELAGNYLRRAYHGLVEAAARLQDDTARQAFFQRDPITRRLMQLVYDQGIESPAIHQTITRTLTSADGQRRARVRWTLSAGPADQALKQAKGEIAVRHARLTRLLEQAQSQGIRPRIDDLAEALGVSDRTIQRDLANLRKK